MTDVSIVIPSKNEGELLLQTVEQVRATTAPDTELIVVDDGSSDGSVNDAVVSAADQVLRGGNLGCAGAKNLGSVYASGHYLVFIDAHMRLDPGWLDALVRAIGGSPRAGLAGPRVSDIDDPKLWGCGRRFTNAVPPFDFEWNQPESTELTSVVPGMCQAFPASVFHQVGRFYPDMVPWGTEDVEIGVRLWLMGYEILAVPSSSVGHRFRSEFTGDEDWTRISLANELKLPLLHYSPRRILQAMHSMSAWSDDNLVAGVYENAMSPTVAIDRTEFQRTRFRTDDDWFAEFGCDPLDGAADVDMIEGDHPAPDADVPAAVSDGS